MHLLVLAIFGKYFNNISDRFRNILAIIIFPRKIFTIFSKYFGAVWAVIAKNIPKV